MDQNFQILPAEETHLAAAEEIAVKAWTPIRENFRTLLGEDLYIPLFDNWEQPKREETRLALSSGRGYVAVKDGAVLGFVSYSINPEAKLGILGLNAVAPEARGLGIGTAMYRFVLDKMRDEGMLYAAVHTGLDEGHAPARRAYEKAGFEKSLPSVNYYQKL